MNVRLPSLLIVAICSSCFSGPPKIDKIVMMTPGFKGAIFYIANSKAQGRFESKMFVPDDGVLIANSLAGIRGLRLDRFSYRYADGSIVSPADSSTFDGARHVWKLAAGGGKSNGEIVEFIAVFIGTRQEFNDFPTELVTINRIQEMTEIRAGSTSG